MKNSEKQMKLFIDYLFHSLKETQIIQFKSPEEIVKKRALEILKKEFLKEKELDLEVNQMILQLEKQNPGGFEKHKMFPLLKKRLAKEKGIIL